ncbi:HU family DNA-binding protein [Nonomuraea cavernae]|uniref:DNA-binding protein HRm n=1 Tax=Nonomuraea cavernae TaxID=2045107 RepID=A0A917YRP1_9ACTN|nr:HU family DNA-binding protein [Nonomuraea cavernae]MCA2184684.1 HU family DNA-binding protein [Nonomuraea cavernae]GGO63070.1 DNA-binding protein HRm [Nonomuraea cavernae]
MSDNTRNLSDIAAVVADATGLSAKDAKKAVQATVYAIQQEVAQGNKVKFINFAVFELAHSKARKARNPSTGEEVDVPETWKPKATFGRGFLGLVQQTQRPTN